MLTKRENLLETIHGGHPDRFVNQFEYLHMIYQDPYDLTDPYPEYGQKNITNSWGITLSWPEGTPGPFPVHDDAHKVLKDITEWREKVKAPNVLFPESDWEAAIKETEAIDRKEQFACVFIAPGIFERLHYLMGMEDAMMNFYEEPEEMHDLIKYLTDWELQFADTLCSHLHPDALFHHDDWGSQRSTFISPAMFDEFILPSYKQIYGYYKEHGVQLIVHHSDSYAETLVPEMIDMGVDIWQGVMTTNNIPEMIKKYGGKITFMGGINSATVDHPGWTREEVKAEVQRACKTYGKRFYIPNTTQGLDMSTFEGVYEAVSEEIDAMSKVMFE
ncbi:MAG: uroporphyrinogen decarboxylase [Eubacterium sp.]|nr:uroporphyrinogen decarboxylase [Eubacterium sp.]